MGELPFRLRRHIFISRNPEWQPISFARGVIERDIELMAGDSGQIKRFSDLGSQMFIIDGELQPNLFSHRCFVFEGKFRLLRQVLVFHSDSLLHRWPLLYPKGPKAG